MSVYACAFAVNSIEAFRVDFLGKACCNLDLQRTKLLSQVFIAISKYSRPLVIWTSSIWPLKLFRLSNDCSIRVFCKSVSLIRVFEWRFGYKYMGFNYPQ